MLASYRWIVGCALLVGFLGGTFVYAKSTEVQRQIPKSNRDNITGLTLGSHGVGPFYSLKERYGLTDFVPDDPAENSLFDIFCSDVDTDGSDSVRTVPGLPFSDFGLGSKPSMPTQRRYELRPC